MIFMYFNKEIMMKKLFCVFLALSVMLFAFPFSVSAASGISVETVNTYLQAGETVYLDITFSVGKYVQAFEFTVTYDPDVLTFKEASDGIYNNYEPGKIKYVDVGSGSTDVSIEVDDGNAVVNGM